jgi:hypothetical protein
MEIAFCGSELFAKTGFTIFTTLNRHRRRLGSMFGGLVELSSEEEGRINTGPPELLV